MICNECSCNSGNCDCVPYSTECDAKQEGFREGAIKAVSDFVEFIKTESVKPGIEANMSKLSLDELQTEYIKKLQKG